MPNFVKLKFLKLLLIFLFALIFQPVYAQDTDIEIKVLRIDTPTLQKGYTIDGFSGNFRVGIFPEVLATETNVTLKDFYKPAEILPIPPDKNVISHIYEFDISNKAAFHNEKPVIIEIKYMDSNQQYQGFKSIYYWDKDKAQWVKIPSHNLTGKYTLRANLHLPYARLAVLEDKNAMSAGDASWYAWKACDCAASPDYPKGTRLNVTNLGNGKSVVITVNDYGPERDKFPNRVIDLDKVAFSKIADPRLGIIHVRVEPVDKGNVSMSLVKQGGQVLGITETNKPDFELDAKAALVVNAKNGEVLFSKNSTEQLPIASITKLMTGKVILDLDIDWNKIMAYSKYDDDVTKYAARWEMAYLNVAPGEKMSVKDLFYSAMVGSANNATYALARATGLIRRFFIETMNATARDLGMTNTHFTEPSGLDPQNISTAEDIAKLALKAFNSMEMLYTTTALKYTFATRDTHSSHTINNHNQLLKRDLYLLGTKTGYLDEAGRCIVAKAKDDTDNQVIVVTLGNFSENRGDYFDEAENLINWGLERIAKQ